MDIIDDKFPDIDSVEPGQDDPAVDESLEELFGKKYHGDHDQSDHGNWAGAGRGELVKELDAQFERVPNEPGTYIKRGDKGQPVLQFTLAQRAGNIRLRTMQAFEPGKGHGTRLLQSLTDLADKHRFTIELTASPYGDEKTRLDHDQLKAFYVKHGFEMEPGHDPAYGYMIRKPKTNFHEHKFEKREPNRYERRVDYAQIEKSLDSLIAEASNDARKALLGVEKRHIDLIGARMDSKLNADDVAGLRIDSGSVLLGQFDQLLHDAWRLGVDHTYHEHPGHAESLRARQFAGLEPEAAMRYFRARALDMKGIIDDDLTEATKQELLMFLKGARSIPESIDNIRRIFEPFVGDPTKIRPSGQIGIGFPPGEMAPENVLMAYRLENIIRTPTTEAYNQGRLAVGDEMEEYVVGYAYSALLDERTTEICQFLDQFMLRKDDPALRKLTPPNHFQCRSILVFITQDDLPVEFTDPETLAEGIRLVQAGFK